MLALALLPLLACGTGAPDAPLAAPEAPPARAAAPVADRVSVTDARTRAMPPGSPATGAFMTLTLQSGPPAAVVGASSPDAATVELHTHVSGADGTMQMRKVDRFDLDPAAPTVLAPGGLHIMLISPTRDVAVGDTVSLTLQFDDGSASTLQVPVREIQPGAGAPSPHAH
ncbi:MAG: copper chaperone PCu(A)C [Alphaproteobacteria bacterium]|nr:copper chaperone PCu(A)C [Alphaproteobacteria bacterium]